MERSGDRERRIHHDSDSHWAELREGGNVETTSFSPEAKSSLNGKSLNIIQPHPATLQARIDRLDDDDGRGRARADQEAAVERGRTRRRRRLFDPRHPVPVIRDVAGRG